MSPGGTAAAARPPRIRGVPAVVLAAVIFAAPALAGCAGVPDPAPGDPAGVEDRGAVLHWAVLDLAPGPIPLWETDAHGRPVTAAPGASATWLRRLVYAGLMEAGPGGRLLPALAEAHEVSGDGLVHRFPLRTGAAYADGTPLRGGDVVRAWRAYLDLQPAAAARVASVSFDAAQDEVVLTLAEPAGWVVRALALLPVTLPDREAGAGRFRPTGEADDRWVLEQAGPGDAPGLRIEAAPVEAAALVSLIDRQVDLISGLTGRQVAALRPAWEAAGFRATAITGGWRLAALINPLRGPLEAAPVRRALAAALDHDAAAAALGDARAVPRADAGAPAVDLGPALELTLVAPEGLWADAPPGAFGRAAGALAAALRRHGLEVEVRLLGPDDYLRQVYAYRAFDLALLPLPLDETGEVFGLETFLAVPGLPPLPISPGTEATLIELAEPVIWALDRLDGTDYRLDEVAGLVVPRSFRQETQP